ncbi:CocE/NonD family hydrolase [Myxosarcina sp. GI1]|uniref:CocE/NonD family hydrolase n=1 Tax=Myxosarcina sp. GI1 TaxID=1541065 RepID=UPI00056B6F4F|nr:CocE/NonD family hydrolase [Myxosarcina sp. GI1]
MTKIIKETASMYTRDRVKLDADIYRPDTSEKLPILLMRQPYGRAIASTVVYAHPRWYAAQGYIVVIQDVRGRGTSEGKFDLFTHEVDDGLDTISWVTQLPNSTEEVGMYGFSYQGMTQLYVAANKPQVLRAIAPAMVAYDLYTDWAYENEAFCLYANLAWAIQLAAETARIKGDEAAYLRLAAAAKNLPLGDSIPANPKIMQELALDSFYHTWLNNPHPETYWQERSPKYLLQDVDLPMLHVGGWFDPYLRGTLNLYRAMAAKSQYPQHLVVGPWGHLPWGRKLNQIDYGIEAQNPIDQLQIRWFDYFLKGKDTGVLNESPISLFEMGSNQWQEFNEFPESQKIYYLASDGLASMREDAGMLWEYESETESTSPQELLATDLTEAVTEFSNTEDILVHDPWRPVPARGGHAVFPSGSGDRTDLDCRTDVLTYTSAPLESGLHIVGEVAVEIYCTADAPSFDLCAVLSTVDSQGRVFNFTQGYIRVDTPQSPITIPLQTTCIYMPSQTSLRLSLSAACFPAYPVNSGTGKPPSQTRSLDMQIITIAIKSGADYPSLIRLAIASN